MNTYDFPKRKQETSEPRRNYDIIYAPLFYEWQRILTKHTFVFAAVEFLKQYWFSIKNIWRLYLYFSLKNSIFLPIISHRLLRLPLAFHLLSTCFPRQWTFSACLRSQHFFVLSSTAEGDDWEFDFFMWRSWIILRITASSWSTFSFWICCKSVQRFFYFKHQLAKILTLRISLVVILCGMSLVRENTC